MPPTYLRITPALLHACCFLFYFHLVQVAEEDKSGLNWPTSRKMIEEEEGDGFAEGQGAWGPDDEEMEDWVDLWGGVDVVGAVNDADILAEDEFSFSFDI